jgi:hypothetical protein
MKKLIFLFSFLFNLPAFCQQYPFNEKIYNYTLQEMDILINNEDGGYYFDDILNKFYEGDSLMTQKELILTYYGFAIMPGYKPYISLELENKIIQKNNDRNFTAAKTLSDSLVGMIPVSTMANEELSYACGRTGDSLGAIFYKNQYEQLLSIILNSGDGKTKKTAYKVIGMKDISVITQIKKMQVTKQKRIKRNDHVYEVLTVFYQYKKQKIYFDITLIETYGLKAIQKKKK